MEGTGEGRGFFCSPKLPYLSTMSQQLFVADCRSNEARALSWDKVGHVMERALFCTRPKSSIRY